jgi:hypothetical protein
MYKVLQQILFVRLSVILGAVINAIIGSDIQYDQIILEYDRWCHIGFRPQGEQQRLQQLIIDKSGTRNLCLKEK